MLLQKFSACCGGENRNEMIKSNNVIYAVVSNTINLQDLQNPEAALTGRPFLQTVANESAGGQS